MSTSTEQKYEVVIGLEVHVQLNTASKMFCSAPNVYGQPPNTQISPTNLGLPGTLPVVNKKALDYAIKIGLALNCEINRFVKFDRKNYFYPDCPKNYQISQFDYPICKNGFLMIPEGDGKEKKIRIHRAHLEEDAGKLMHESDSSLVDFNRTGTPLLEIVTEPDIRSPQEAYDYLQILKLTIQYLDVSDCDMEKGSLRCDANISIREFGTKEFGTKAEIKNMNSFRAVKAGLEYEIGRQIQLVEAGERIVQETRLWDENKGITAGMRSKEESHDYRYFPEPDLVPFTIEESKIEEIRSTLPELPEQKLLRFISELKVSEYDARIITQDMPLADFFEKCLKLFKDTKKICNWINGPVLQELNESKRSIRELPLSPENLTDLINKVEDGTVSNLAGKDILKQMINTGRSAEEIIAEKGLTQVSDEGTLDKIVEELINEHVTIVEQIKNGKENAVGFLVGQAMKKSQGKANPKKIGEIIRRRLLS